MLVVLIEEVKIHLVILILISHKKIETNEDISSNINILQCYVRNLTRLGLLVDHINKYAQISKIYGYV